MLASPEWLAKLQLLYLVMICCRPSDVCVHDGDCKMNDSKGYDAQIIAQHQGGPPVEIINEVGPGTPLQY